MFSAKRIAIAVVAVFFAALPAQAGKIIIAHRGASGYLPEHTLPAYAMAHAMGAAYIEPDLVRTKDGHFICLHDIHLESTTDVEARFPERKREDGRWYAIDFTLAEIKTLEAHERLPGRFPIGKSLFRVPAFEEMIELVQGLNASTGRQAGIYPELKAPSFHAREGQPMEADFLALVRRYGYAGPDAKIYVQCFEAPTLKKLRRDLGCRLPQIQLISGSRVQDAQVTPEGLKVVAEYAEGIGPDKNRILKNPDIVEMAHACGLEVHPYTLRRDQTPKQFASFEEELEKYYIEIGVDGFFTDQPDVVRAFLDKHGL
jgi:glycerophosphoryl diester phosphodiesterase